MILQILNFIMISGILQGFIFIVATSITKRGRHKSVIYLNLVVLFLTLNNLQIYLVDNSFVEVNFYLRKLLIPWYLLIFPSFYTFLTHYLKIEQKIYSFVPITVGLFLTEIVIRIVLIPNYFYENNNYLDQWEGYSRDGRDGKEVPEGVYMYVLRALKANGLEQVEKNTVTILRQ